MTRIANLVTREEYRAAIARAAGSRHVPGQMNPGEASYARHLELARRAGAIQLYQFEPPKLRLALRCFFTPDFRVVTGDGFVEYHEVKGRKRNGRPFVREDAMLKLRFAADKYRDQRWLLVWPDGKGGWQTEVVRSAEGVE